MILVLAIPVLLVLTLALARTGAPPAIEIEPALPGIGPRTPVAIRLQADGRGLGDVRVELVQEQENGERSELLHEEEHTPRPFWAFWGERDLESTIELEVGRQRFDWLEEGEATLRVSAERAATVLRRPAPVVVERRLPVRLRPPRLAVTSTLHYARQGGSELVVYSTDENATRHGVLAGDWWFPGYDLPGGGPGERFSLFGLPYDLEDGGAVRLVAADALGNEVALPFLDGYTPQPLRRGEIRLSDRFMARVVPEIVARSGGAVSEGGELLETYLTINGELRAKNLATLTELAGRSRSTFLWWRPFEQLPNSQVMSPFAVRRSYLYEGEQVDRQDHLGYDLASRRRAPVPASNSGQVVLADYLGIFGNTVVLDHGYGLMSLYAHLSSIGVEPGQEVARRDELGRTGETGLAGGDHLHFSILLQGLAVDPVEWWDGNWIRDRLARKLGAALPFER